jgi:hypothetical protein
VQPARDGTSRHALSHDWKPWSAPPLLWRRAPLFCTVFTAVIGCSTAVVPEQQNGIDHVDLVIKNIADFPA